MSNADPGRARPVFQWLAQLFALMGKESKQIIRDPSSYLVAAILPMIFLLLFGYGITLDAGVMDIVILDESNSQSGLQLQENFAHSPNFRVHQARSRSEAGRMMRDSVISGFIVIPYNFEALLVGGQGKAAVAPIQVSPTRRTSYAATAKASSPTGSRPARPAGPSRSSPSTWPRATGSTRRRRAAGIWCPAPSPSS